MGHYRAMEKSLPPLRMTVLSALLELKDSVLADPNYFDSKEVLDAYGGQTLDTLKKILAPQVVTVTVEKEASGDKAGRGRPTKEVTLSEEDQKKVEDHLRKLMTDLDSMGTGEGLETSQRVAITRLQANVLEQVIKLQERHTNVKRMSQFMENIIGILDDIVDEKGREIFMKRIDGFR